MENDPTIKAEKHPVPGISLEDKDFADAFPTLSRRELWAAIMLAQGVPKLTVRDRLKFKRPAFLAMHKKPEFYEALQSAQVEFVAQLQDWLRGKLTKRLKFLDDCVDNPKVPWRERIKCAAMGVELAVAPSVRRIMSGGLFVASARAQMELQAINGGSENDVPDAE